MGVWRRIVAALSAVRRTFVVDEAAGVAGWDDWSNRRIVVDQLHWYMPRPHVSPGLPKLRY
jgi:hypothetical protein